MVRIVNEYIKFFIRTVKTSRISRKYKGSFLHKNLARNDYVHCSILLYIVRIKFSVQCIDIVEITQAYVEQRSILQY